MKLISLNTWAGRVGKDIFLDFFERHKDVDIFCLQEVWQGGHEHASLWGENIDTTLMTSISSVLTEHEVLFYPHYMDWYGIAIYVKKDIRIIEEGDIFVFKYRENMFDDDKAKNHARNIQWIKIDTDKGPRTIINFHGLWNGISKEDTKERMIQADNIVKFLKNVSSSHVLCGDFNLMPENKSLKMIEDLGMRNLITEFDIISTRSSHYKKPERFADYTLVDKGIQVHDFKVLPDEVSDHLAMYLEFD